MGEDHRRLDRHATSSRNFPDGAEDPTYTGLTPPYRTANMPLTRASELLAIAGLRPRALSQARAVRHGAADRHADQSLHGVAGAARCARRRTASSSRWRARTLRKRASSAAFPTKQDFESRLSTDEKQELVQGKVIDQTSSYFRATIWVTIGTTQFTLYSLLYRSGNNGLVRPILRSHGTP